MTYPVSSEELRLALELKSAAEVVLIAAQCLRVGSLDHAVSICQAWNGDPDPAITLMHAAALFGQGQHAPAIQLVDDVLTKAPDNLAALFYRAQMAQHAGDLEGAQAQLMLVLERFPDFPGAQAALASLRLPGPPYRDVLRRLHELLRPHTYLEIGVETGATLSIARSAERIIGIDPDATRLRPELVPPNARVFHETSDGFFARHARAQLLGPHCVDLAFIDGLHLFEQALRDFMHVEAWCAPGGAIVLHDCLAVFPLTASRERRTKFWVGDVWKVVQVLSEYRPDLSVKIIATPPSGLCVVRKLDPDSRLLSEHFDEIVERYLSATYPADYGQLPTGFHCVPATDAGVQEALG